MGEKQGYKFTRARMLRAATAALVAMLVVPAAGSADSIVYVDDGDIYLINPDGTGDLQVTNSGTYWSPRQADDGTIVAVKDAFPIVHLGEMNQAGKILSDCVPAVAAANASNRLDD